MLANLKEKFNKLSPTAKIGSVAFVIALLGGAGFMGYSTYHNRKVEAGVAPAADANTANPTAPVGTPTATVPNGTGRAPTANVPQAKENKPAEADPGSA